ncbi:MAG: hypothetical protein R2710_04315 [Acidimicrobiales bacterium]
MPRADNVTVQVANNGPSRSGAADLVVELPADVEFDPTAPNPSGCAIDPIGARCAVPSTDSESTVDMIVPVRLTAPQTTTGGLSRRRSR